MELHCCTQKGRFSECQVNSKPCRLQQAKSVRQPNESFSRKASQKRHEFGGEGMSTIVDCNNRCQEAGSDLVALLKGCAMQKDLHKGVKLHMNFCGSGLLRENVYVGTALVNMYAKCGALETAQEVFEDLVYPNTISWNALIAGYAQHGCGVQALDCFQQMQSLGICPNGVTYTCILKACASVGTAEKGGEIHARISRKEFLCSHVITGNALLDMYVRYGALAKARHVFDELPMRNVVTWNTLISGYAQHGRCDEALKCADLMQQQGCSPNGVTYTCILKACGSVGAIERGEQVYSEVVRQGLLEDNAILGTAVVDMYVKCGAIVRGKEVFDELPVHDIVSWNSLLLGYVQNSHGLEALNCFEQMQYEGIFPDSITFTCIFKACGTLGAAVKGEDVYVEVARQGKLEKDMILGTAVVDMFAKCGAFSKAQEVFDELPAHDVVTWCTFIAGYAQLGKVQAVVSLFNNMAHNGVDPNIVSIVVLLSACSHSGLLDEGEICFGNMIRTYSIIPTFEHHVCMVDLFSRSGCFDKAMNVIENLSYDSCGFTLLWSSLLGICRIWGDSEFGKLAFDQVIQLNEKNAAAYVCMSDIFVQAEAESSDAMRIRS